MIRLGGGRRGGEADRHPKIDSLVPCCIRHLGHECSRITCASNYSMIVLCSCDGTSEASSQIGPAPGKRTGINTASEY